MANQYNVTEADHIALMKFIRGYTKVHGYPPAIREMIEPLGLASTCPTKIRLVRLEEFGWIVRTPRIPRAIRITRKGHAAIKAHDLRIANETIRARYASER